MRISGTIVAFVVAIAGCSPTASSPYLSVSDIAAQEPSNIGQLHLTCRGEYRIVVSDASVFVGDFAADPLVAMTAGMEDLPAPAPASVEAMSNFWLAVDDNGGVYGGVEPGPAGSMGGFIYVCDDW
jgi:hypothetical protein